MNETKNKKRNSGIDALRVLSMLGIVWMHILYKGGILSQTTGIPNAMLWLMEIVCYCAVNCYAMISGYVMYSDEERPQNYANYLRLWCSVFFWSFGITLCCMAAGFQPFDIRVLLKSAFPILSKSYWYFNAYTVLFFLIPSINKLLRGLTEREMTKLVATVLILFSVVGLLFDPFGVDYGYHFSWLIGLYLCGAWIKKCGVEQKVPTKWAATIAALCVLVSWAVWLFAPIKQDMFIKYISPTMVLYAGCLVVMFAKLRVGANMCRVIGAIAPATFGVYLIHEHGMIQCRFEAWFGWIAQLAPIWMSGSVLLCGIGVFAVCAAAESARRWIFRICGVEKLICRLVAKVAKKPRKLEKRDVICYNQCIVEGKAE